MMTPPGTWCCGWPTAPSWRTGTSCRILVGVSPLLRRLLTDADQEEQPCLAIPDTSVRLMSLLLRSAKAMLNLS